jgi:hypothetical protein
MFLSVEDIERLTGYKRKKQQCEQLTAMHIPYRVNARNEPIVAETHINGSTAPKQQKAWQPNLSKLAA